MQTFDKIPFTFTTEEATLYRKFLDADTIRKRILIKREATERGMGALADLMLRNLVPIEPQPLEKPLV